MNVTNAIVNSGTINISGNNFTGWNDSVRGCVYMEGNTTKKIQGVVINNNIFNHVPSGSTTPAVHLKYVDYATVSDNEYSLGYPKWFITDCTNIDTLTNHSDHWNTAYNWGNHAAAGYLTNYTETDPTVNSWAKSATKPSYSLIGGVSGQILTILFTHDLSNTIYTVAFSPQVFWLSAPAFTNTPDANDIVVLKLIGSTWFGQVSGPYNTAQ